MSFIIFQLISFLYYLQTAGAEPETVSDAAVLDRTPVPQGEVTLHNVPQELVGCSA